MLRALRITIATIVFALLTLLFLDFTNTIPSSFVWLTKIQFYPAWRTGGLLVLLGILLVTLLTGRIYCSTICPLGIWQDVVAWFSKKIVPKKRYFHSPPKTYLRWTFFALFFAAIPLHCGFLVTLLEPYSFYGRIAVGVFSPIYLLFNNLLAAIFTKFGCYYFYYVNPVWTLATSLVTISLTLLLLFFAFSFGRTWCNAVCPIGTLLGFVSRFSLFKVRIDQEKCIKCGLCERMCKAGCIDSKEKMVDYSRCVACFNCLGSCRKDALHFTTGQGRGKSVSLVSDSTISDKNESVTAMTPSSEEKASGTQQADTSKREFLAALSAMTVLLGASACGASEVDTSATPTETEENSENELQRRKTPIAPPGAKSIRHLNNHCSGCHLCVAKCPSHVLKPAFLEYGIAGIMQPVMSFERGFCNFDCVVCTEICPCHALIPLSKGEKHLTQVGQVHFVKKKCIVYTDGTDCGACAEHCPTQAVTMVPYEGTKKIPQVNPDICVGCGACEHICPILPDKAIFVEGNFRHQKAQPFVEAEKKEIKIDDFGF